MATLDPIEVPVILRTRPDLEKIKGGIELLSRLYLQERAPQQEEFQVISDACTAFEELGKLPTVAMRSTAPCLVSNPDGLVDWVSMSSGDTCWGWWRVLDGEALLKIEVADRDGMRVKDVTGRWHSPADFRLTQQLCPMVFGSVKQGIEAMAQHLNGLAVQMKEAYSRDGSKPIDLWLSAPSPDRLPSPDEERALLRSENARLTSILQSIADGSALGDELIEPGMAVVSLCQLAQWAVNQAGKAEAPVIQDEQQQRLLKIGLVSVMRELSEEIWCAGWFGDLSKELIAEMNACRNGAWNRPPSALFNDFADFALCIGELPDSDNYPDLHWRPITDEERSALSAWAQWVAGRA